MVIEIGRFVEQKGYRVRLTVNDEEYEGVIANVIPSTLCVALGKARCLKDGEYYSILYFYTYEIESFTPLNGPCEVKKVPNKLNNFIEEDGPRLVKLRPLPFHERGKSRINVDTDNLLIGGIEEKKESEYLVDEISDKSDDEDDVIIDKELKYPVPETNVIVDKINDDFQQVILSIMKEPAIGISLEGLNIGRHGKVCWILVCTQSIVYMFDICNLGKDAFDNGLKDVLQNPSILKIFHDCRQVSDALFHQYNVNLVNIFDTQSSDALVQFKLHNRMPRRVRSLAACLSDYLKLDIKIPDCLRACHQQHSEKSLSVWMHRPLPKKLVKAAAKQVMFLKELRFAIFQCYVADLNRATEIYLNILKGCSEQELELSQSTLHMVPTAFEELQVKNKKYLYKHHFYEALVDDGSCCKFNTEISDPFASVNKNLWHKTNKVQMNDDVAVKINKQESQTFSEHAVNRLSRAQDGKLNTNDDIPKQSTTLGYSSLTNENSTAEKYASHCLGASVGSEKQYFNNSFSSENQPYARESPKTRIDWPKICSQRANGATNAVMIPAGMVPLSAQYPRKKQGS